jgi:hypothetical protein
MINTTTKMPTPIPVLKISPTTVHELIRIELKNTAINENKEEFFIIIIFISYNKSMPLKNKVKWAIIYRL